MRPGLLHSARAALPNGCGVAAGSAARTRCRESSPIRRSSPICAPSPTPTSSRSALRPPRADAQQAEPEGGDEQHEKPADQPDRRKRLLLLAAADPNSGAGDLAAVARLGAPQPVLVRAELELPLGVGAAGECRPV